jgi:hypothetical protein
MTSARITEPPHSLGDCSRCGEPVLRGIDRVGEIGPGIYHLECEARMVIGGANHLLGRCTCCGGTEPPDNPALSKRDQARAALAIFRANSLGIR